MIIKTLNSIGILLISYVAMYLYCTFLLSIGLYPIAVIFTGLLISTVLTRYLIKWLDKPNNK